jgi:hypothetical protein
MEMAEKSKFDQVEITQPDDAAGRVTSSRMSWREAAVADHFVQFYRDDSFLVEAVAGFIGSGLRTVEGGIIIATEAHRLVLEEKLEAQGVDLRAARARRQYVPLDAAETLARFMVNGMPDEVLFTHVVGSVVTRMVSAGFRVRAFGEMVALLWADENPKAAIHLERLWNNLGKTRRFALFCAYPMTHFEDGADAAGFRHICAAHAGIISVEGSAGGFAAAIPAH